MPLPLEPTENYLTMAIQCIESHGGTKDPKSTAIAVWFYKMSDKQRRKWARNKTFHLSPSERSYLKMETWAWKVAGIASRNGEFDSEKLALLSAGVAGFLAPDVANHVGGQVSQAWDGFWSSIGNGLLGTGGGSPINPTLQIAPGVDWNPVTGLLPEGPTLDIAKRVFRWILTQGRE